MNIFVLTSCNSFIFIKKKNLQENIKIMMANFNKKIKYKKHITFFNFVFHFYKTYTIYNDMKNLSLII